MCGVFVERLLQLESSLAPVALASISWAWAHLHHVAHRVDSRGGRDGLFLTLTGDRRATLLASGHSHR